MADIISHRLPTDPGVRTARKDLPLILGVSLSVLALTYLAAALHTRYVTDPVAMRPHQSMWFPLQLFVIATSPAVAGFIFLWSERHLQNKVTQKFFRGLAIFGIALLLAACVAFVPR